MYYGNKYRNKKVQLDGITFDSQKEANRYAELKLMQQCGGIKDLQLQKEFILIPAQYETINGKKKCVERACKYKADFYYYDMYLQKWICEDVKGYKDSQAYALFVIKRKLMLYNHGIRVVEI